MRSITRWLVVKQNVNVAIQKCGVLQVPSPFPARGRPARQECPADFPRPGGLPPTHLCITYIPNFYLSALLLTFSSLSS